MSVGATFIVTGKQIRKPYYAGKLAHMTDPQHTADYSDQNSEKLANSSELVSVHELIKLLKEGGIRIGRTGSDSYNTLRYYTKIGFLPHMVRKFSEHDNSVVGHYPLSVVKTLKTVESLKKQGMTNPDIYDYLVSQDVKDEEHAQGSVEKHKAPVIIPALVSSVKPAMTRQHAPAPRDESSNSTRPVSAQKPVSSPSNRVSFAAAALAIVAIFAGGLSIFWGLTPTQVSQINTTVAEYNKGFVRNFMCNVASDLAGYIGYSCDDQQNSLAQGDVGHVLAQETQIGLSDAMFVEYNHAAIFSDTKYATMRLDNFALEVDGEWIGPDFLVAQSRGEGVFYVQAGGSFWALGNGSVSSFTVRDGLVVSGSSQLSDLTVKGTSVFDRDVKLNGLTTLAKSLTTGDAEFAGGIRVTNGDITLDGNFIVDGPQSIVGSGTLMINPNGNLYLQSVNNYIDENGELVVGG
ncbi:hypothetical protein CO180_03855, partial [candidate division WWE3 bacterium CG_4_9_14_3_um_filter_41_6]